MMRFELDHLFKARGIKRKYTYLKKIGFTHTTAQRYSTEDTVTMKLDHIEKICLALNCTPNDLINWQPEATMPVSDDHPLHELRKTDDSIDLIHEIQDLPLEKLDELKKMLNRLKEGD